MTETRMDAPTRPIGYWLKRLDRSIEDGFDRDLATWSLTRRHWQVLHAVQAGYGDEATIGAALQPFWTDEAITRDEVVNDLLGQSWITRVETHLALTPAGKAAHARLFAQIRVNRARMMDGLTAQDYNTVVRLLEQMTINLDTSTAPQRTLDESIQ